jgi:serine/threonine protein kinase
VSTWLADRTLEHLRDVADWPDLGDRYRITGRLGRGGMSTVFAAHDERLDREVAVKVLDVRSADAAAVRLAREAQILARLEHPGIVPVHDAGTLPDGRLYYAMKLVRGRRLDQVIAAPDALTIVGRVCDAVSFAHAQAIVHGDLKPENIMVGPFGEVLVMDWGVAAVVTGAAEGLVAGTPGFMAPEQAAGKAVDVRADVYGLGALLEALSPPPLPKRLAAIVARAKDGDPARRYQTVAAMAADLARYRDGAPVDAYRESIVERGVRIARRYRVPIGLVLAYMLMRLLLILAFGR